jgi:hypothetical protein
MCAGLESPLAVTRKGVKEVGIVRSRPPSLEKGESWDAKVGVNKLGKTAIYLWKSARVIGRW